MAPITPVITITSTHTSLLPALNMESSGTLTTSTRAQTQKMKAAIPRMRMMAMTGPSDDTIDLLRRSVSQGDSLPAMPESHWYPTERERAVRATLLGSALGLLLLLLARGRQTSYPEK
jgi:hypothetical protein